MESNNSWKGDEIMKKILLFFPRTLHEKNYRNFHVPYSLLAISLNIDRSKYDIEIIDNNVWKRRDYQDYLYENVNTILCVGISCMIGGQITGMLDFAKQVKEVNREIPVIVGGGLPTMLPELTIENEYIDIIMMKQGENAFPALVEALNEKASLQRINNIWYKDDRNRICKNQMSHYINVNTLPPYQKVYNLCDLSPYIHNDEHIGKTTISYHSSQGCTYSCGFCCEVALWKRKWSGVTTSNIIHDISYLKQKYQIDGVKFYDSEFFIDHKRAIEFAKLILSEKIAIRWGASIHPINFMSYTSKELDCLMYSGLTRLLIGIESAVADERTLVGKNFDNEIVFEIAQRCKDRGIFVCFTFVTSYPGMPEENFQKTLAFCKTLASSFPMHEFKLHLYGPYPGTPMYQKSLDYGFIPPRTLEEWSRYDYYSSLTPWSDRKREQLIREYNKKYYPYLESDENNED